jgi:hypothetical protein
MHGKWVNMRRARGAGKTGMKRLFWLCPCLLVLAGCSTAHKGTGDPLFGVNPKGTSPAAAPPASTSKRNETSLAPTSGTPNLAWLNSGPLPDSRPLAISQGEGAVETPTIPGSVALASAPKGATAATPSTPVPVVQPVPRAGEDPVVPASTWNRPPATPPTDNNSTAVNDPSQVPTVAGGIQVPQAPSPPAAQTPAAAEDPLVAQLRARGVTWQKAENVAGGVRLTCIVPDPQHPEIEHRHEAVGPDYAAAVRGVLYLIDKAKKAQTRP